MFTGLIEDVGTIRALRRSGAGGRVQVATTLPLTELRLGDSIAVNGACLTVVDFGNGTFEADISPETLERTTLGNLVVGNRVNLERALRLGDRLGGHLVSGHIDSVAVISERRQDHNAVRLRFVLAPEANRYLVAKGSVAIDGISLTVNSVDSGGFSVAIIPHTLAMTTLVDKQPGDRVNIETDLLARYVERLLAGRAASEAAPQGTLDADFLAKHGFL